MYNTLNLKKYIQAKNLFRLLALLLTVLSYNSPAHANEFTIKTIVVDDLKAVFGSVASRNQQPARSRIGGTVVNILVEEGSLVAAGEIIATITDDKLALKLNAINANINALSVSLINARRELNRGKELFKKGVVPKSRLDQLQTQTNVLTNQVKAGEAERSVLVQQITEGKVLSPSKGRVLTVPKTNGSVVMAGEAIATIAGGGYFLRLALPERHATLIKQEDIVFVAERTISSQASQDYRGIKNGTKKSQNKGRVVKVYPQIQNGRIIIDVEVKGLDNFFIGERILVWIPIAKRRIIAVPPKAISTRSAIDFVTILTDQGPSEVVILPGPTYKINNEMRTEILSGLTIGDKVVLP